MPRDDINAAERRAMVRNAAQFGTGIGPDPGYGFWARPKLGPTGPSPLQGGTSRAVRSNFGFEVSRRRKKLQAIFDVIDKRESAIAGVLEQMVETGKLTPFAWGDHA